MVNMSYSEDLGNKSTNAYLALADRVEELLLYNLNSSLPSIVHIRVSSFSNATYNSAAAVVVEFVIAVKDDAGLNQTIFRDRIINGNFYELSFVTSYFTNVTGKYITFYKCQNLVQLVTVITGDGRKRLNLTETTSH